MTILNSRFLLGLAAAGLLAGPAARAQSAAPATITVQVNKPGAAVPKNMYGLFFEDINFAADGGLYPELVKNKSFETDDRLIGWKAIRGAAGLESYIVSSDRPISNANNHFLRLSAKTAGPDAGFVNEGFRGMGVKQDAEYTFSIYARRGSGSISGLTVTLEEPGRGGAGPEASGSGRTLAQTQLTGLTGEWKKYSVVLKPSGTAAKACLKLTLNGAGTLDLDVVSLFPKDTYMKPGFLRFPGGCIVEGRTLAQRYQWKKTIGEVAARKPLINE